MGKKPYIPKKRIDTSLLIPFIQCQQYNGNIPIFDKVWSMQNGCYFWFEFSVKPTPVSQIYRILFIKFKGYHPDVYLLYPMFPNEQNGIKPVPHRYNYETQELCLTFPNYKEWKGSTLPDNYIPWTTLWLYYYEEWLYSGEWKGGGLEPSDPEVIEIKKRENEVSTTALTRKSKFKKFPSDKARKICLKRREIYIKKMKEKNE